MWAVSIEFLEQLTLSTTLSIHILEIMTSRLKSTVECVEFLNLIAEGHTLNNH